MQGIVVKLDHDLGLDGHPDKLERGHTPLRIFGQGVKTKNPSRHFHFFSKDFKANFVKIPGLWFETKGHGATA
jgi:hypothetical protein